MNYTDDVKVTHLADYIREPPISTCRLPQINKMIGCSVWIFPTKIGENLHEQLL